MSGIHFVAQALAEAWVVGRWEEDELVERGGWALRRRWRWLRPLARRMLVRSADRRPLRHQLSGWLEADVATVIPAAVRDTMRQRTDWGGLLDQPLPDAGASPPMTPEATQHE